MARRYARAMALELERTGETVTGLLLPDEIHRPPTLLSAGKWGERGAILFETAREYLPPTDLAAIEAALAATLSAQRDAGLDRALTGIGDPAVRKSIKEQVAAMSITFGWQLRPRGRRRAQE